MCNYNGDITFEWEYLSKLLDLESLLSLNLKPEAFYIPPNTLKSCAQYTIKLTATMKSKSIIGSNTITLSVNPDPLVINLDKTQGSVSKNIDLVINAYVSDPNSPNAIIEVKWSCIENTGLCKDAIGSPLLLTVTNTQLTVRKMTLEMEHITFLQFQLKLQTKKTVKQLRFMLIQMHMGTNNSI